ncbi:ethylene receptor 2-like [Zingiber officinale]|uniref:ethylene receptor 2-like n=1 Tax=Zingiber officinale TaxID=94328 RepID=UPI001C4CB995|nr:ethylene receptor 2-like [Zingiber officinale]XP_042421379.1 ethylene receptor 2-like [Zingiber officinale]
MKFLIQTSRAFYHGLLLLPLLSFGSATELEFPLCDCDGDRLWSIEGIRNCQKASDLLIAAAYFSIPLELLYFVTCSKLFPFKWILFQFSAFIVLCGMTHLLNVFTYKPHSFLLVLALTISKFLTALVSFLTAITLLTLIPQLLKVKLRENFLRLKAHELDQKVGLMKRQEEVSWHVRMLTQEIRKSLDRHTILYTTLVELSKTLQLQNCAVWMPNESKLEMVLTHELNRSSSDFCICSIPMHDPDVFEVEKYDGVKILKPDSTLGSASSGAAGESGVVAAIRMPMLKVSNFEGGTPEVFQAHYAILVLVLPKNDTRIWSHHELELIEVVSDQVAVALSHAAVLEESHVIRDKLVEQNKALLQAKQNVMMASQAWNLFQKVMSQGIRRPIHSIVGLLSLMQQANLSLEQRLTVNAMAKTGNVVSTLINDVMVINREHFTLEMKPFQLQSLIKETACVARCLCDSRGFGFEFLAENMVLGQAIGDERRILHVLLHIIDGLLNEFNGGCLTFCVRSDSELADWEDARGIWKSRVPNVYTFLKFEITITQSFGLYSNTLVQFNRKPCREGFNTGFSFSMCKKIVQLMQGEIFIVPSSDGLQECVTLILRLQKQLSMLISESGGSSESHHSYSSLLEGLKVLIVDDSAINRVVTQKLLKKLGCCAFSVSSGTECLIYLDSFDQQLQLVILDLSMPNMNGYEVAMKIRSSRDGCWPLIIAFTASTDDHVWTKCMQSGMNGLIRKPVLLPELEKEILRVFEINLPGISAIYFISLTSCPLTEVYPR